MHLTNATLNKVLVDNKLPASSFRIGQILGGPPQGAWSTTEWLPIIIKSSVSLGALPEAQGLLSWIPPHAVSNAILDVAFAEEESPITVNLVHPRPIPWTVLMRPVADAIYDRKITRDPFPLILFSEQPEKLEASAKDLAIKLLDFMRFITRSDADIRASRELSSEAGGFRSFSTAVGQRVSLTLKALESLSADAAQWVAYWEAVGMFQ